MAVRKTNQQKWMDVARCYVEACNGMGETLFNTPVNMGQLSKHMGLSRTAVSKSMEVFENSGLVVREKLDHGRFGMNVFWLTADGIAYISEVMRNE